MWIINILNNFCSDHPMFSYVYNACNSCDLCICSVDIPKWKSIEMMQGKQNLNPLYSLLWFNDPATTTS